MDKLVIDSDAIIGNLIPGDSNHEKAHRIFEGINDDVMQIYVTNLVIYEVATVLSRKHSQNLAVNFLNEVLSSNYEIVFVDEHISQKTVSRFKSYSKKNISFVDSANLVVAEELHIPKIFSFDRIYGEKRLKL